MIIPNSHTNSEGDIVFELTHTSSARSETKKQPIDRKTYKNWLTFDPIKNEIVKFECECYDFIITRASETPCKHLEASIKLMSPYFKVKKNG